mmetsp:Transcript_58533/g.136780  ORF Transcript_58533/g.136780 Transcript_58533/m.136780 type:complete len:185 (-) Transcript_58533:112-666(-)
MSDSVPRKSTARDVRKSTIRGEDPEHHGSRMRNTGPGKWREWRWESYVIPLFTAESEPPPAGRRPLPEVSLAVLKALTQKGELQKLRNAIEELVGDAEPDDPESVVSESAFRSMLIDTVSAVLSADEVQQVLPATPRADLGSTRRSLIRHATGESLGETRIPSRPSANPPASRPRRHHDIGNIP